MFYKGWIISEVKADRFVCGQRVTHTIMCEGGYREDVFSLDAAKSLIDAYESDIS